MRQDGDELMAGHLVAAPVNVYLKYAYVMDLQQDKLIVMSVLQVIQLYYCL